MPFVNADWSVTRATRAVRYIGDAHGGPSPSYATTIELHRALQDFADDPTSSGDDQLSMVDQTPSDRGGADTNITMLNGYNIDQTASEHLYDGSITQAGGAEIYDGIVNFGDAVTIQVLQNGAVLVNDFWNEPNMTAATSDSARNISHRWMSLVRTGGVDIDGRRLVGTQRAYGTENKEFPINGTERGNNVLALTALSDLNNQTPSATVATFTDIVNDNEGFVGIDGDGNGADEFYYSNWELAARSKNDFYEYAKYLTREGTAETLYGLPGDLFRGITHEIDIDTPSGSFQEPEAVSWSGGTGQLLAIDSVTAGTKMYIQLLTGVVPTDNQTITGGTSSATAAVNVTVATRTVSVPFIGASTGSAIIGAFGLGIGADDLTQNDLLVDLTGTPRTPPNNVTVTIAGLVSGEDFIMVGPETAGGLNLGQFGLSASRSGASVTTIAIDAAIPTDTPSTGTILVQLDSGKFLDIPYTSFAGSTFTIATTDFSGDNAASSNDVFIGYLYKLATAATESFTRVYNTDRTFFVRRRDGGASPTKTFETTVVGGNADVTVQVQRLSDA